MAAGQQSGEFSLKIASLEALREASLSSWRLSLKSKFLSLNGTQAVPSHRRNVMVSLTGQNSRKLETQSGVVAALRAVLLLLAMSLIVVPPVPGEAQPGKGNLGNPGVIPPKATRTYEELSAQWWQWGLSLPVTGHPFLGCPNPSDAGQAGPVWFLAGQFGTTECDITVPPGKRLFFPLANAECSSLEDPPFHGDTAEEQRDCAKGFADAINIDELFCEIDGVPVQNLASYRFVSPQFRFTAPTPWIFGATGGTGTAVGDGYYLLLAPLSPGSHTLHFGGNGIDTTYHLTVAP